MVAEPESDESALVIHVPEAEELVGAYRMKYDPAASVGVPAHITLLWPFIPPPLIKTGDHDRMASLFSSYPVFEFALTEVRLFTDVLYLAPAPSDKIIELTRSIVTAFPGYPPYGGQFPEIIPHLTIAQSDDSALLEKISQEIAPSAKDGLPISKKVTEITLLGQRYGFWSKTGSFALRT